MSGKFHIFKKALLSNTSYLASSSIVSQVLLFSGTFFFIKLYSSEEFGAYAIFISIVNILSVFATGKYEQALFLPKLEKRSFYLVILSISIAFIFSLIVFLVILLFFPFSSKLFQNTSEIALIAPFALFTTCVFNTFSLFLNRLEKFKEIAILTIINALLVIGFNLLFGHFNINQGLIYAYIISQLIVVLFFFQVIYKQANYQIKVDSFLVKKLLFIGKKYNTFPKYSIWYYFLSVSSQSLTQVVYGIFFGKSVLGYYSLANRILRAPFLLIVGSFGNIFRIEVSKLNAIGKSTKDIYIKTLLFLFLFSFLTLVPFIFFSKSIITLVFGIKWASVSEYCKAIFLLVFTEILEVPLSYIYVIKNKQNYQLAIQCLNVIGTLVIFLGLSNFTGFSFLTILFIISCYILIINCSSIYLTFQLSRSSTKSYT